MASHIAAASMPFPDDLLNPSPAEANAPGDLVCGQALRMKGQDLLVAALVELAVGGYEDEAGKSPRSGIHSKVDALPGRMDLTTEEMARGVRVRSIDDTFGTIVAAITESHGRVDLVYELEGKLPTGDEGRPDPEVRAFAVECCQASVKLTATLWYSARAQSEKARLPGWSRAAGH